MSTDCPCDRPAVVASSKLTVAEAQERLALHARCVVGVENLPLAHAEGRILAQTAVARLNVPPHDNSAMDGYGFRLADIEVGAAITVSQRVPAGGHPSPLTSSTCVRIFTGAPIPPGVDVVVPQEDVTVLPNGQICLFALPREGQHIRRAGEDTRTGMRLLDSGRRLGPVELGLLASQGVDQVSVYRPLRVGLITTGNELVLPGSPLEGGQIYNSNRYQLTAALHRLGCDVTATHIADDAVATREALLATASTCDLVLTTGGVSVGEEDHVKAAVAEHGEILFTGVAMKPGKPFTFGHVKGSAMIGLPGNPAASLVTFDILTASHIRRLAGETLPSLRGFPVEADFTLPRAIPRQQYLQARLAFSGGTPVARLNGSQSSGVLSSAADADGYLVIPPYQTVERGMTYEFILRAQCRP